MTKDKSIKILNLDVTIHRTNIYNHKINFSQSLKPFATGSAMLMGSEKHSTDTVTAKGQLHRIIC